MRTRAREDLIEALHRARCKKHTTVIVVELDLNERVPGYESWLDLLIAEVSEMDTLKAARIRYNAAKKQERYFLSPSPNF